MKYGQFFVGLLVGAVAMHVLHKMGYMSNNPKNASDAVKDVNEDELSNYSDPLRKKYDIVLKPNKYSRRVVEKAKDLTEGRYEVDLNRVKQPVSI
jgi:hypothetical protein